MVGEGLTDVDAALQIVLQQVVHAEGELCATGDGFSRALAREVIATRTLPAHHNSAMDGYALRSADAPGSLRVVEQIFAGQISSRVLQPLECARIMTGAALPPGADAVVMQEHVTVHGDHLRLEKALPRGANVRAAGEDAVAGQTLLPAGTALGLGELGMLWAQGLREIEVRRRPRVSICTSGDELAPVGDASGALLDTNSPMLALAVERAGGLPRQVGIARDTLAEVTAHFRAGLLAADVLITVAGASVGDRDFARAALERLGVEVLFHRVAMKPGKPLLFGRLGSTLVFGLPGNPTSALVCFELFVRPALRKLQGLPPHWQVLPGRLASPMKKAAGLRHFVRVSAETRDGALWATPLPSQTSGALASAAGAQYLMSLPAAAEHLAAGALIDLISVTWGG